MLFVIFFCMVLGGFVVSFGLFAPAHDVILSNQRFDNWGRSEYNCKGRRNRRQLDNYIVFF